MITIGLTGGIGSGKSYICQLFKEFGVVVYHADDRAKELMVRDEVVVKSLKDHFGENTYLEDGRLNRSYLAQVVFSDNERLSVLNSIVHPAVLVDFSQFVLDCETKGEKFVMMEAAVLIESGFHQFVDKVVVVSADRELRLVRTMQRDQVERYQVESRMAAQMNDREREAYADYVIINDEKELILPQILEILNSF